VQTVFVDTRTDEEGFGQIIREILNGDSTVIGATECVKFQVLSRREMAAEVVLVATAGIKHDRTLRGVRVFDERLRIGAGDDANAGTEDGWQRKECAEDEGG
jgi:hypothetical protein